MEANLKSHHQHRINEGPDVKKREYIILRLSYEKCKVVTEDKTVEKLVKRLNECHTRRERGRSQGVAERG